MFNLRAQTDLHVGRRTALAPCWKGAVEHNKGIAFNKVFDDWHHGSTGVRRFGPLRLIQAGFDRRKLPFQDASVVEYEGFHGYPSFCQIAHRKHQPVPKAPWVLC